MKKNILLLFMFFFIIVFFYFDIHNQLSFSSVKEQQANFKLFANENPIKAIGGFLIIYILVTSLSLPGAATLTLLGGALFGPLKGLILVSLASTTGATLAFLISRFLFKDYIQNKFQEKLEVFNQGVKNEGGFYLFTLRLIPAFPFFLINLVMGLTPIKLITYIGVSFIGMLPGTFVYISAGTQLAKLESLKGLLSPNIILSFALLGLFPLIAKKALGYFTKKV